MGLLGPFCAYFPVPEEISFLREKFLFCGEYFLFVPERFSFWAECDREKGGGHSPTPRTIRPFGPNYAGPMGPFSRPTAYC